jgi:hypothetical protein
LAYDWPLEAGSDGKLLEAPELLPTMLPACKLAAAAAAAAGGEPSSLQAVTAAATTSSAAGSSSSRFWRSRTSSKHLVQIVLNVAARISISIRLHLHERHLASHGPTAIKVVAPYEVQWLLLFRLACIVQQLQDSSKKQQRMQNRPAEQLLAALIHLCTDLAPSTAETAFCLIILHRLTADCVSMMSTTRYAAESSTGTAAAELISASERYKEALHALVEPLLHRLGPAVLKAVRKLEQEQSGRSSSSSNGRAGGSSSSSNAAAQAGASAGAAASVAAQLEDSMRVFGKIVLLLFDAGGLPCNATYA